MALSRAALKLGLELVQLKLGQAMSAPGFSVLPPEMPRISEYAQTSVPAATASIKPPKIVTTR